MIKTHFINSPPKGNVSESAPAEELRAEFARRLQRLMAEKGWNQSETARRAAEHMPGKTHFGRDNVSCYVRGISMPRSEHLHALAKALGVKAADLIPAPMAKSVDDKIAPALDLRDVGKGRVWLRVNTEVSWETAVEVMKLVKGATDEKAD